MQYTINELRKAIFRQVYQVYEVFQNFFGEDYVDLQNLPDIDITCQICGIQEYEHVYEVSDEQLRMAVDTYAFNRQFILIYWPRVRVTNENDRSVIIQDLYAKVELDINGCIPTENRGFTLNRATYPMEQWESNYMHSHIDSIPKDDLERFKEPCLGSGPIKATINNLRAHISEGFDETRWMLFCQELSLYVTVESLRGVPYKRLENIHLGNSLPYPDTYNKNFGLFPDIFTHLFYTETLRDFILHYLHNGHLAISYYDGEFRAGMPYFDYMVDISNSFIEYFNSKFSSNQLAEECFHQNILCRAVMSDGKFFHVSNDRETPDVSSFIGRRVCFFKGREITLRILGASDEKPQNITILNNGLAMYILNNILKIINYHYTNEFTRQHREGSTTTFPAPTNKRVYYI